MPQQKGFMQLLLGQKNDHVGNHPFLTSSFMQTITCLRFLKKNKTHDSFMFEEIKVDNCSILIQLKNWNQWLSSKPNTCLTLE